MRFEMSTLLNCAKHGFPWPGIVPPDGPAAAAFITKCVRVRTGISSQYVYRSLYAAQLHRALALGVDLRDLLVLDADDLRNGPQAALDRVSDHARGRRRRQILGARRDRRAGPDPAPRVRGRRFGRRRPQAGGGRVGILEGGIPLL